MNAQKNHKLLYMCYKKNFKNYKKFLHQKNVEDLQDLQHAKNPRHIVIFFLLCQVAQEQFNNSSCKLLFLLQGITDSTLSVLTEYLLNKTSDREAVDPEVVKRAALISLCGWKIRSEKTFK